MEFLDLTSDLSFKAYFTRNKGLLISLLSSYLPLKEGTVIVDVKIDNPELLPGSQGGKDFILDLLVKTVQKGPDGKAREETVIVEVQTTAHVHFIERVLSYWGRLYSEQLEEGDKYEGLRPMFVLVFMRGTLGVLERLKGKVVHFFRMMRTEKPHVVLSKHFCFVVIELGKFTKGMDELGSPGDWWNGLPKGR